jgi:hypothetical protein
MYRLSVYSTRSQEERLQMDLSSVLKGKGKETSSDFRSPTLVQPTRFSPPLNPSIPLPVSSSFSRKPRLPDYSQFLGFLNPLTPTQKLTLFQSLNRSQHFIRTILLEYQSNISGPNPTKSELGNLIIRMINTWQMKEFKENGVNRNTLKGFFESGSSSIPVTFLEPPSPTAERYTSMVKNISNVADLFQKVGVLEWLIEGVNQKAMEFEELDKFEKVCDRYFTIERKEDSRGKRGDWDVIQIK